MSKLTYTLGRTIAPVAVVLAIAVSGCKKLIDIPGSPPNAIPTTTVFSDSADIMAAVVGVYGSMYYAGGGTALYSGLLTETGGLSSDELAYNLASDATGLQFYNNALTSSNSTVASIWSSTYKTMYPLNACLENIPASTTISDSLKMQLLGEMKTLRALLYFDMVNLYAGVPLITTTDYHVTASQPRASVDSIYSFIINELTGARALLKAKYPSAGKARINRYTADAILAKVYLYRQQWTAAANLASEVINSNVYSLVASPSNVFYDGSTEAIWQIPSTGTTYQTAEGYALLPNPYLSSAPYYSIAASLFNAIETGDKRASSWIASKTAGGLVYNYPQKYKNRTASASPAEDYMMMRLGEIYLIRAEALANQGKTDSAIADINTIRTRAGLAASTASAQEDVLVAIAHERQIELMFEQGNRWFDLKRTGQADAVLGVEKSSWTSDDALFPIPQAEITGNSNLTQNHGY